MAPVSRTERMQGGRWGPMDAHLNFWHLTDAGATLDKSAAREVLLRFAGSLGSARVR